MTNNIGAVSLIKNIQPLYIILNIHKNNKRKAKLFKSLKAFTLTELMVVIAIVALLAAVATPAYKQYIIKTKVSNYYEMLRNWQTELISQYNQQGSFPASTTFHGVTVPSYTDTNINALGINYIHYRFDNDVLYVSFVVDRDALGLPDNGGVYTFRSGAYSTDSNGVFKTVCGTWVAGDNDEIPADYRPSMCTCSDMWGIFTGSTSNCQ